MRCHALVAIVVLLAASDVEPQQKPSNQVDVVLSRGSSRINGVELRIGSEVGVLRFFSLRATKKALGAPEDTYVPRGVRVYAWRSAGIHLQQGWRGPEKGKLFKLQVYFEDDYDKFVDKHTGTFAGKIRVDGVDLRKGASLESIRLELESRGYEVGEDTAKKGEITIFCMSPSRTVTRVEQWCL